jgi:hypothetical protein
MPVHSILILIAMTIALWQWGRMRLPRPIAFRPLGILFVLAMITEFVGGYSNTKLLNNTDLYNAFNFLEGMLVLLILYRLLPGWHKGILAAAFVVPVLYITVYVLQEEKTLLYEAIIVSSVMLVVLIMAALWQLAEYSELPLQKLPAFWLLLGFLIYFAGIVPIIGLHHFIYYQNWPVASKLYKIVPALCIIRYLLAAYACRLAITGTSWAPQAEQSTTSTASQQLP